MRKYIIGVLLFLVVHVEGMEMFENDPTLRPRMVAENAYAFAFLGNMPIVPGHTLICPKRRVAKSAELTAEEWCHMLKLKDLVCSQLVSTLQAEGFNFAWNEGELAGQSVPHFHLHVVPRKKGDTGITQYEPRVFLYRPGERCTSPQEELASLAAILRESIKKLL